MAWLRGWIVDERAQNLIEYGLLSPFISLAVIAAVSVLCPIVGYDVRFVRHANQRFQQRLVALPDSGRARANFVCNSLAPSHASSMMRVVRI